MERTVLADNWGHTVAEAKIVAVAVGIDKETELEESRGKRSQGSCDAVIAHSFEVEYIVGSTEMLPASAGD